MGEDPNDWGRLFRESGLPMCIFEVETLELLECNDAFVEQYGWTRDELSRMRISDLRPPEQRERFQLNLRKFTDSGARHISFDGSWKHQRKDGSLMDIRGYATKTTFGGRRAVLATLIDETARRDMEARAQERERRFRALVEHGADCIVLFDADNRITYASPAQLRALGYQADEMIGQLARDFVHPDDLAVADAAGPEAAHGVSFAGTLRLRHKDGSWRWHEGTSTNLLRDEAVRAVVSNRRDVTDQRRLEEQLRQSQKLEAIGLLAGGVAHDFNNLLAIISGYTEASIAALPQDHRAHGRLKEVSAAAQRGADLTAKLLAFSRKQVIQPRAVDLTAAVREFSRMFSGILGQDIDLVVAGQEKALMVHVDPVQLDQVLLNLCTNARQAMKEGGRLSMSTGPVTFDDAFVARHPWARAGRFAELTVTDTGVGMDDASQAHAFEPFFTTKSEGTGLGLATVYGIVEQHGGLLHLTSSVGDGTRVSVYLEAI